MIASHCALKRKLLSALTQLVPIGLGCQSRQNCPGHALHIIDRHQRAVLSTIENFRRPAGAVRAHNGAARQQRFDHHIAKALES